MWRVVVYQDPEEGLHLRRVFTSIDCMSSEKPTWGSASTLEVGNLKKLILVPGAIRKNRKETANTCEDDVFLMLKST
jgi:hypothetical protein